MRGEFDSFDLNVFFTATGEGAKAKFKYEDEVQRWLDLIRGSFAPATVASGRLSQNASMRIGSNIGKSGRRDNLFRK